MRQREGAYSNTLKVLHTMMKHGQVGRHRDHASEQYAWFRTLTKEEKKAGVREPYVPENFYNRRHEFACADVYVAYKKTGLLEPRNWDAEWMVHQKDLGLKFRFNYDRRMQLYGKNFYWEIDRGSENLETIEEKIHKYKQVSNSVDYWFYVIFTVAHNRRRTIDDRCEDIVNVIQQQNTKRYQFLVARQPDVLADPLGKVFVPAADPTSFLSLQELT